MRRSARIATLLLAAGVCAFALPDVGAADEWKAPPEAAKVQNPAAKTKESLAHGRLLYLRHCMTCHGITGKGDGPESAGLDPAPGDFTNAKKMSAQTDGDLFWKLGNGKGKMKPYSELVPANPEQDRWELVNFIRTLSPAGESKAGEPKKDETAKEGAAKPSPKAAEPSKDAQPAAKPAASAKDAQSATKPAASPKDAKPDPKAEPSKDKAADAPKQ